MSQKTAKRLFLLFLAFALAPSFYAVVIRHVGPWIYHLIKGIRPVFT